MKFTIEYDQIPLDLFRDLPAETYSERFFRAGELTNVYVDANAWKVLDALGAAPGETSRPAWELASGAGVRPERVREFRWLLEKIAWSGQAALDRTGAVRATRREAGEPAALRPSILADDAALAPVLDLIDAAAEGYPAFLRGEREGNAILFNARTLPAWDGYFSNRNPVYAASNRLGAYAAARAAGGRRLSILEVGGGLGSGAEALLEALVPAPAGGRIETYVFTELSPGFLRRGQDRLLARFPEVPFRFAVADLNRGLGAQGIPPGKFDLVYAVNTLHAVRDLVVSLGELRAALAPGGFLVLVEAVRPSPGQPLASEFVFQLLREFRELRKDPRCRPHGGFLEWPHWRESLRLAGFTDVKSVPEFEPAVRAYPQYAMAALVARRPEAER